MIPPIISDSTPQDWGIFKNLMKANIKSYLPVIALAIVLTAITMHKPAQAQQQSTAERLKAMRPIGRYEVVVFEAQQFGHNEIDSNGVAFYQTDGLKIFASSSSSGAPKFVQESVPQQEPLTDLAEGIATVLSQGYKQIGTTYMFVKPPENN